ncbi:TetR/AcrR family transcriptional regulator [Pseudonocardia sp. CA-107938]|uniref:TetR/AcrR family transcriptional regulator n=1 Tax=Pseudonocardia sp. CA-107938 TaxID=3240021 RepID=UPI003D8F2A02
MARRVDPERTAARRAAIVAAAGELFATRGFDGTTAADIGRAAGISAASVFYYFPDKQSIFRAIFAADLPAAEEQVRRHADSPSALAGILATVEEMAAEARWSGAAGLMVELLRVINRDEQLQEIVGTVAAVQAAGLAALIRRAGDAGEIAPDLAGEQADETAAWIQGCVDAAFLTAEPGRDPVPHVRRIVRGYLITPPEGEQ